MDLEGDRNGGAKKKNFFKLNNKR
nr:P-glycoprotein [Homo sapiens]